MSRLVMALIVVIAFPCPLQADGPSPQQPKSLVVARGSVVGRVIAEPGGKGVSGAVVKLWDSSNGKSKLTRTDQAGAYSFPDVAEGSYKVWVHERPDKAAGIWSEGVVVDYVKDQKVHADDLCLSHPQSISGVVTDIDSGRPVPDIEINFSTADKNRAVTTTDREGRYRLYVTPRHVQLYCNGNDLRYYSFAAEEDHRNEATRDGQKTLLINPGANKSCDFKVKSAPRFSGLVVLPDGTPARGLDVLVTVRWDRLSEEKSWGTSSIGDGDGTGRDFFLKTDDTGRFVGYLRRPFFRKWKEFVLLKVIARTADKVIARTADKSSGGVAYMKSYSIQREVNPIQLTLAPTASIKLRLLNPDGKPITDAKITGSDVQPLWHTSLGGPVTHLGEGVYSMTGLIPGLDYFLAFDAPGYVLHGDHRGWTEKYVLQPGETRVLPDFRLEWWGRKAVPRLVKQLQHKDPYEREGACHKLAQLGPDAAEGVAALIETLQKDERNSVRFNAAAALGKIGPAAKTAVPHLIRALKEDTGGGVQREAATALGLIGDPTAIPALVEAAKNPDRELQIAASASMRLLEKKQAGNTNQ